LREEIAVKKQLDTKYPESAILFQFCRRVLDHKFGGVRIIDQDVGQILGFDPADCSHWKKGKKNVRSIHALKKISDHLGIDERLLMEVATGEIDDLEGYWEFSGYGHFELDTTLIENARKDFMRSYASNWDTNLEQEFKAATTVNEASIDQAIDMIHQKINFKEAPLYIPELLHSYPTIRIVGEDDPERFPDLKNPVNCYKTESDLAISYPKKFENKPYIRYLIAKSLSTFFLNDIPKSPRVSIEVQNHIEDVTSNIFAAKLLIPAEMLRKELKIADLSKDIITQLSDVFWTSKNLIHGRIKSLIID
jgi:hypothetical protein